MRKEKICNLVELYFDLSEVYNVDTMLKFNTLKDISTEVENITFALKDSQSAFLEDLYEGT